MKTIIFIAFITAIGLVGCSVSQPGERDYYPPQSSYSTPYGYYDPYYAPQVYDNRYYDPRYSNGYGYNNAPVYVVPVPNRTYRRERGYNQQYQNRGQQQQNREQYREQYRQQQQSSQPSQPTQQQERRLPDGSRVSPDGSVTLPNGTVRHRQ
jgi:hypothetical protein